MKQFSGNFIFFIIFSFLIFSKLNAQELKLTVQGKVIIDIMDSLSPDVNIIILKNKKSDKKISTKSKFKFDLDFQKEYIFKFEKKGYRKKEIYFNTSVPKDILNQGFEPFIFNVELFRNDSEKGKIKIKNPVARIKYNEANDSFDYKLSE